jgi:hypothetical protein
MRRHSPRRPQAHPFPVAPRSMLPVWESRHEMAILARATLRVATGRTAKEEVVA